tara:strand:+ start:24270 stop:24560 length:291 start_codon:yes stop_codon:yes gene_type:complete
MEIKQSEEKNKGSLTAYSNEIEMGKLTYTWAEKSKLVIDHTEVNPEFGGRGVGKQMVLEAVKLARATNSKILPFCVYAKSVFDRTPEIQDVLFTYN